MNANSKALTKGAIAHYYYILPLIGVNTLGNCTIEPFTFSGSRYFVEAHLLIFAIPKTLSILFNHHGSQYMELLPQ